MKSVILLLLLAATSVSGRVLEVTVTAYSSHSAQTDSTPFLAAWNNKLDVDMKLRVIAVSRDLLTKYGLKNGSVVFIEGFKSPFFVKDKMNKRYKKRIDLYYGLDQKGALKWGKQTRTIYFN